MRKFSAITHYEISRKQLLKALEELEVRAETKLDKLSDKNKLVTYSKSDDLLLKEELAEKERMIEELQNSLEATQEDLSKTNDEFCNKYCFFLFFIDSISSFIFNILSFISS